MFIVSVLDNSERSELKMPHDPMRALRKGSTIILPKLVEYLK